ncbi:helix-turn-helix domain-containing protein [Pistricoccus aurantiacus]
MSQSEVARRLEVTQGAVSQWVVRARQGGEAALKTQPRSGRPPAELVPGCWRHWKRWARKASATRISAGRRSALPMPSRA